MYSIIASILSILLVLAGIVLVILIAKRLSGFLIPILIALVVNTLLGFLVLYIISFIFGLNISFTWPVTYAVAIFGLPAVGTILILKIIGGVALFV